MRLLRNLLLAVFIAWLVGCVLAFIAGFLLSTEAPTQAYPLPWSDFRDFVETPDGKVFAYLGFYGRVVCYDRDGKFIAAYLPPPTSGMDTRLATDPHSHVFFRNRNVVYTFTSDWQALDVVHAKDDANRTWELSAAGLPAYAPQRAGLVPPDRPLKPGELLFGETPDREEFLCADGARLRRAGNGVERVSPAGDVLVDYRGPWWLRPFEFPFPAALAWPATFVLGGIFAYRQQQQRARDKLRMSREVVAAQEAGAFRCRQISQTFLERRFEVTTPEATYQVVYDRRGFGYESVYVDGVLACRRWLWMHFEFPLGSHRAALGLKSGAMFHFEIDGQTVYIEEGYNPLLAKLPDPLDAAIPRPPGSAAIIEAQDQALTITIPPLRFGDLARSWFHGQAFSLIGVAVFIIVMNWLAQGQAPWFLSVCTVLFFGTPLLLMALVGLAVGRRSCVLSLVDDVLRIEQSGPFGQQRGTFPRDRLVYLDAEQGRLRLLDREDKVHWFFAGHSPEETQWVAALLRRALGLSLQA